MAKIGFKKLQKKLMAKGKSRARAGGLAYVIGAKKYGRAKMAKMAAAGRKKAAHNVTR